MANPRCATCGTVAVRPDPEQPHLNARWYKNQLLADITIKYGDHGEKEFVGHRLVFCSVSEWFKKASKNFKEANDQVITLKGDHPEGLEAFFEYAYKEEYLETVDIPDELTELRQRFMHRLRVFAVADKYQVEGLTALAYRQLKQLVDLFTEPRRTYGDEDETTAPEFFRFMVRSVYEQSERYFPALRDDLNQADHTAEGTSSTGSSGTECPNYMPTENAPVSATSQRHNFARETTCNPPNPHSPEGKSSNHPLDRVQDLLVEGAMNAWVNAHPDFNRQHLVPLAQMFPDFGTDLIVAALKSSRIEGLPEYLYEDEDYEGYDDGSDNEWLRAQIL
ncbi:uncharacterized protein J4E79_010743 [Alternaria viburni]|uniref:uncharacterized protein n=1 Tax=Alternaria viburni TaxID=566460 RepID=UPI0020C26234|nr:uncharacterized protein J4E79_010743 [Alternaria viburni]KAI4645565.1 hypothetical protein J4E79_010743 [Alternaria viburni]